MAVSSLDRRFRDYSASTLYRGRRHEVHSRGYGRHGPWRTGLFRVGH